MNNELPSRVDFRQDIMPDIENQFMLNSCSGNAIVGAMEYLDMKNGRPHVDLSRLFIYFNSRGLFSNQHNDTGSYLLTSVQAAKHYGICSEELWPYDINKVNHAPSHEAYQDAKQRKLKDYKEVFGLDNLRHSLSERNPVIFSFRVPAEYNLRSVVRSGVLPLNKNFVGWHAVFACGYCDKKRMILFQNSAGTLWGDKGYGYIPYEYFEKGLARSCFALIG